MNQHKPSVFTEIFDTTPHFGNALKEAEALLQDAGLSSDEDLGWTVKIAYYYSFINLPKGVVIADAAISKAELHNDNRMKAYALCAKGMSLYRIGYTARARAAVSEALTIFESAGDEAGIAEACYHIGTMVNISVGPTDTAEYLGRAIGGYTQIEDATGLQLALIQRNLLLMFEGRFDEAVFNYEAMLAGPDVASGEHLRCRIYSHLAEGMFLKPDLHACKLYSEQWLQSAEATGNFHDYTRTSSHLPELRRQEGLDQHIVESCIEAIRCCEALGSYYGYATSAIIMANICMDQLQYDDAIYHYRKGSEAAREIEYVFLIHMSQLGIGNAELKKGNGAEAQTIFHNVLQQAIDTGDKLNQIAAYRHLAELALGQAGFDEAFSAYRTLLTESAGHGLYPGDYGAYARVIAHASDAALLGAGISPEGRRVLQHEQLEICLSLAKQQSQRPEEAKAYHSLSEFYEEEGDLVKALAYSKLYIGLHEQIINEETNKAINKLRLQYEAEMKDGEIALLKKEHEEALLSERLRISRDLHDDIGATLSSISVYSSAVKQRLAEARISEAEAIVDTMSNDAQEMVSTMSDMVWMMNPGNDLPGKLLDRMRQLAANVLVARGIPVAFTAHEQFDELHLSMEVRKNIFLIMKEALNNIGKYAEATDVCISIDKKGDSLAMTISDNGRGFSTGIDYAGNGLQNIKARIKALGGQLNITSEPGKGTTVSFTCPRHPHK